MKFRMKEKVGGHNESGKDYHAGDIVESPRPLDKLWPHKFDRLGGGPDARMDSTPPEAEFESTPIPATEVQGEQEATMIKSPSPADVESALGENVTADYPAAENVGLLIFRKGPWHYVSTHETPEESENEKGLKKADLVDFLADDFGIHVE